MRVRIAGRDRTDDLGRELTERSRLRPDCGLALRIAQEADVLSLSHSRSTADYSAGQMRLLRSRNCVDTSQFDVPARAGLLGRMAAVFKRFLWRVLRYQHDWSVFRQNSTNVQLSYELEFEREERAKQIADLERRVRELEARLGNEQSAKDRGRA